jgi:hypothetical protein
LKPLRLPARPARGEHEPTAETRETVMVLEANGIPMRIIARCIGTSVSNVRKHYRRELRDAHWQIEATMVTALVAAAQRGNWGAARYWLMVHSRNPKWKVQPAESGTVDMPGGASNSTTITIRGGLPPDVIEDERTPPLPSGTNGAGTDPPH